MKIVLDTNIIIASISRNSQFHIIFEKLKLNQFEIYITNEILLEYFEILQLKYNSAVADSFFEAMNSMPNVHFIDRLFESKLIETDLDDNKFIDCAYAANVNFLVTNDKHFDRIKLIEFPKLNIISIQEFIDILNK
jgi:uncharacterized protein